MTAPSSTLFVADLPAQLTEEEFDAITQKKSLCNENQEVEADHWDKIMRLQMVSLPLYTLHELCVREYACMCAPVGWFV